jgi:hypothetical protein
VSRGGTKKGGDEIDAVKAFIVIMAILTVLLAGYTLFVKRPERHELETANLRAKDYCRRMFDLKDEVDRYLTAYQEARQTGFSSPEEYFAGVRDSARIDRGQMGLQPRRETGRTRDFKEYFTLIQLKDISWAQAIQFMWNTEHSSPKYKILSIDDLRRADAKKDDDLWRVSLKAAYRTQRED